MTELKPLFPSNFIWGTAASSTQCEGAAPESDWFAWESAGKAPYSGKGNGFWDRYRDDFRILKQLGLKHHRLAIEWARIEPADGVRDSNAIRHYLEVLDAAGEEGISIWACLHHFTLPKWFSEEGGFLWTSGLNRWRRHLEFVNETFGELIHGWKPINEPVAYAALSYLTGMGPPGVADISRFQDVLRVLQIAWRDAWEILGGQGRPVATIHNLSPVFPASKTSENDRIAANLVDQTIFGIAITALRDGVIAIPGREPEELDGLANSADYFGFSYYNATAVSASGQGIGEMIPYPPDAKIGPMGYAPWAEGIGLVIDRLSTELPEVPVLVAENGIGTSDDCWRAKFLTSSLATIADRIDQGAQVKGYFHWTACDNYEWLEGFDVQFGIIDKDRNVKKSARVLTDAILGERRS